MAVFIRVCPLFPDSYLYPSDILSEEETFDEDQISERLEKLYNLKNYPFNALEVVPNLTEE